MGVELLLTMTVVVVLALVYIVHAGENLRYSSDVPGELDIVATFAPEKIRYQYTRALREKHNSHWIINDPNSMLTRRGQFSESDLENSTVLTSSYSTYHEMLAISKTLERLQEIMRPDSGSLNVALVSSPHHMRRIKMLADRYIRIKNINVYFLPVPQDIYESHLPASYYPEWWKHRLLRKEALRNLVYVIYGYKVYTPIEKLIGLMRANLYERTTR